MLRGRDIRLGMGVGLATLASALFPVGPSVADTPGQIDLQVDRKLDPTDQDGSYFGISTASAGDVNGDGFDDVVAGARNWGGQASGEGRAYLYLGSLSGLKSGPATFDPTDQLQAQFGQSVASAGDINGDGFDDVVIGAPQWDGSQNEGRAFVYLGSPSGLQPNPLLLDPTDQVNAQFGQSVASAGDVNSDGYDDILVGASGWNGQQSTEGRAYIYLGSAGGLKGTPITLDPTDHGGAGFGYSVASAGDVNSDGYDDIVVGAISWDGQQANEGRAYIYFGSGTGLQATPTTLDPTDQQDAYFGSDVASAGDINSDGSADVIVGSEGWDGQQPGEGRAYVYLGSPSGLGATPVALDPTDGDFSTFGRSVAPAGDVNADGFDDFIVGAVFCCSSQNARGRAYIYLGAGRGPQPGPVILDPPAGGFQPAFGVSVASGGDINSDGFDDVLVGSRLADAEASDEGRVYVYGHIHAPELRPLSDREVDEGETLRLSLRATDRNGDVLTYSATGLPAGATFNPNTRLFSWTPSFEQAGTHDNIVFTVSDANRSDSETIAIDVVNVNRAPVFTQIGNKVVEEADSISFDVSATDPDSDPLTYSAPLVPQTAQFNPDNQEFSWVPGNDDVGTHLVRFQVSDGWTTSTHEIYIKVKERPRAVPALSLKVAKSSKRITATGQLVPAREGEDVLVTLSKKVGGVFKKISTGRDVLDEVGSYVVSFTRPSGGTCKLRAFFRGDDIYGPVGTSKQFSC